MSEQIRAAFHRHLQSRGIPSELFQRDDNGAYEFATVEHDWSVWQAALAANSASSATPCAEQCWACAESGIGCNLANDCAQAPAPQAVVGESSEQPDWPGSWLRDGFNGCMLSAIAALQYLANNTRPAGGSSDFNSEHLFMIASDLAVTRERLLVSPAPSAAVATALEQERAKFQQETRRTSELSSLLKRWIDRHEGEHGPGPWARSCVVCALVGESNALLAKPINDPAPNAAPHQGADAQALADELDDLASELHYEGNQEMSQEKQDRAALIYRAVEALRARALHQGADALQEALSQAERDVLAERRRQIEAEGYSPDHDAAHGTSELSLAAAAYALSSVHGFTAKSLSPWPWETSDFKPKHPYRDLERAGALVLAAMECWQRRFSKNLPSDQEFIESRRAGRAALAQHQAPQQGEQQ